jgi:hypothetical protein
MQFGRIAIALFSNARPNEFWWNFESNDAAEVCLTPAGKLLNCVKVLDAPRASDRSA